MTLLSGTKYHLGLIVDQVVGNTPTFSRAATKTNYAAGADSASGDAQFETNPVGSWGDKQLVPDHAVEATRALLADRDGVIWGASGAGSGGLNLYKLDPSGSGVWSAVNTMSAGNFILSIHQCSYSGYLFVGSSGKVLRSIDGGANWSTVITFPKSTIVLDKWGFADKGNGTIWVAEYGGDRAGASATDAVRIYKSTDSGATWTTIFNLYIDFPASMEAGIHLHKLIYHAANDTLYISHGDTPASGTFIYKSAGGVASNWLQINPKVEYYTAHYKNVQPTSAVSLDDNTIMWFDDAMCYGAHIHNVITDAFTYVPMTAGPDAVYFQAKLIGNTVYVASRTITETANTGIFAFNKANPYNFVFLDFSAAGVSWDECAGLGNDGFVYFSYSVDDVTTFSTVRYRQQTISNVSGLSVDPITGNLATDPFLIVGSGGWASYANKNTTLGKYPTATPYCMELKNTNTLYMPVTNLTDPIVISFWAKRTAAAPSSAENFKINVRQYKYTPPTTYANLKTSVNKVKALWFEMSTDWQQYTIIVDPANVTDPFHVDTTHIAVLFSPGTVLAFYVDCLHVEQTTKPRPKLCRLASGSVADSVVTTLASALPTTFTAVGKTVPRFQFDTVGTYCLWSAYKADASKYLKLVLHNGQLKLIDQDTTVGMPIIATTTGLPTQIVDRHDVYPTSTWGTVDMPPDTICWAVTYSGGDVGIQMSTQRSVVETVVPVTIDLTGYTLTKVYDGSSQTAGEEISGMTIFRSLYDLLLTAAQIKTLWGTSSGTLITSSSPRFNLEIEIDI
jgi:hypothetical protein